MKRAITHVGRFLQGNLLWLLILAYVLGAIWPAAGLWIRGAAGTGAGSGWLLKVMLALLLLNAGLRLDVHQLRHLARRATLLGTALGISVIASGLYVLCLAAVVGRWASANTAQEIVLGLAVVAAMPVAASSTAWAQNADGNLALSLGLLLVSTLFSPLAALVILHTTGTVMGSIGMPAIAPLVSQLVINLAILLVLNYANASLALPSVLSRPEPLTLVFVTALTLGLAVVSIGAALLVSRLHDVDAPERASLLFAMGMRNNGAGLVLVATAMAQPGSALLPIIVYNLIQHLTAAVVDRFVVGPRDEASCAGTKW